MTDQRCRTCRWWWPAGPALAAATRRAFTTPDLGTCHVAPPVPLVVAGGFASVFPETHGDRHCGEWEADADDGGGGERLGAEIAPIGRAA